MYFVKYFAFFTEASSVYYIYNKFDIVSCAIAKTLLKTIEFPTDSTSFGRGCLQGT